MRGTVLKIIQQTCGELGLPVPVEAVSSKDTSVIQLVTMLDAAGYELCRTKEWQFLDKVGTITSVAGQDAYDLPDDFTKQINQTLWSSSLELTPVDGPISPQIWQTIKNGSLGSGSEQSYRIQGDKMLIDPIPDNDGEIYNFEYISDGWVQDASNNTVFKNRIISDQDKPLFDFWLLVKFLKVKMWTAKGLNTTEYQKELARLFDSIAGTDKGAPVLNLSHSRGSMLLSNGNVPEGNWRT